MAVAFNVLRSRPYISLVILCGACAAQPSPSPVPIASTATSATPPPESTKNALAEAAPPAQLALLAAPVSAEAAGRLYACPLDGKGIARGPDACAQEGGKFNSRRGATRKHEALDINSQEGVAVLAIRGGKVSLANAAWGEMGGTVLLDHGDGDYSIYGHLGSVVVRAGTAVAASDKLGTVGYTGNAECLRDKGLPPHLHLAIFRVGKAGLGEQGLPLKRLKEEGHFRSIVSGEPDYGPVDPEQELHALTCWF